jgi:O-antigen/teichoic acid export membrane protein
MFTIPSFFGLSVLSKSILMTLTTSEFIGGYLIVPIIALATLLYHFGAINIHVLFLLKKTKTIGLIYGAFALINMVMNIILVPLIGIMGAAIATLMTFMAQLFVATMISFRRLPFDIDFKFIMKSIISAVIMAFVVWKLNPYGAVSILIAVGIATGVYFGLLILLRGFTKEEYLFLKSILRT